MFQKLLEKYSLSEKKRLESRETYFKLKKDSLSRHGIYIFFAFFFILYIAIAFILDKKICFFLAYMLFSYIAALGAWAIIHPKVYKYVFNNEVEECKLYVPKTEKFMIKYVGTLLGFFYISISIVLFLYASGIVSTSSIPNLCNIKTGSNINTKITNTMKECVDICTIEKLMEKKLFDKK